jgi:CheY-like chemotaxis protein
LIIDDEAMICKLAGLSGLGYEVEFNEDGEEAVVRYEVAIKSAKPFDAVILDLDGRRRHGWQSSHPKAYRY